MGPARARNVTVPVMYRARHDRVVTRYALVPDLRNDADRTKRTDVSEILRAIVSRARDERWKYARSTRRRSIVHAFPSKYARVSESSGPTDTPRTSIAPNIPVRRVHELAAVVTVARRLGGDARSSSGRARKRYLLRTIRPRRWR